MQYLRRIERFVIVALFLGMVVLFFGNIVVREVFSAFASRMAWTEEAVRRMNTVMVFLSLGLTLEAGRHIAVGDLWIQEKLREGELDLVKVLGSENPADIFTKPVERATLVKMMDKMALESETGRSTIAPHVANISLRMHNLILTRKLIRTMRAQRSNHEVGGLGRSRDLDLGPSASRTRAQEQIPTADQPTPHG